MTPTHCRFILALFVLPALRLVRAFQQNITVDDAASTGAIPVFFPPSGAWKQGASCTDCFAHPDSSEALNGTWHDATFTPADGSARAIEFSFNGTALYVFFILANTIPFTDTLTNVNFILDDVPVDSFLHEPTVSSDFEYNVPVYVNDSLPFGQHRIRMEAAGNRSGLILFDYLTYTSELEEASSTSSTFGTPSSIAGPIPNETETPKPNLNIGPVIGGAIGGVAGLTIVTAVILCYWKCRKHDRGRRAPDQITNQQCRGNSTSIGASMFHDVPQCGPLLPEAIPYRELPLAGNHSSTSKQDLRNQVNFGSDSEANVPLPGDDATILRERVELLLDEVVRLRNLHLQNQDDYETGSETLPGYSEGRFSPDAFL